MTRRPLSAMASNCLVRNVSSFRTGGPEPVAGSYSDSTSPCGKLKADVIPLSRKSRQPCSANQYMSSGSAPMASRTQARTHG
jgi:hypothetical protein